MTPVKVSYARIARRLALGGLLVLLAVILFYFVRRRSVPTPVSSDKVGVEEARIDRKANIQHYEFRGEKDDYALRADVFYAGEDGLNHLEGSVVIVDYSRKGGREITIAADKVGYDANMTRFIVEGNAKIRSKNIEMESSRFDYDKNTDLFRTDRGCAFSTPRLKGRSAKIEYRSGARELRLEGDLSVEILPQDQGAEPLRVKGDRLIYRENEKRGEIEGNLQFVRSGSRASAGRMMFLLSSDERKINELVFREAVKADLSAAHEAAGPGGGDRPYLEADTLKLWTHAGTNDISTIETIGNCFLRFGSGADARREVRSGTAILYFTPGGEMKDFMAAGNVRMSLKTTGEPFAKDITCDKVLYNSKSASLRLLGIDGSQARVESPREAVDAREIILNQESRNMQASGFVKFVLQPGKDERAIGFFSKDQPVFITGDDLRYMNALKRFQFRGAVRAWQGKQAVTAQELDILEDSGEISCRGGVKSVFSQKSRETAPEERIEIAGEEFGYHSGESRISYDQKCSMSLKNVTLSSGSISVFLKPGGSDMETIVAKENVVIRQDGKEGRGEEAKYDIQKDILVLTGRPVLFDKDRGATEGDKLTFHLGDGRIFIENRERGRSVSVIKS